MDTSILQDGYASLQQEDHEAAAKCYKAFILSNPDQPIGYIGAALAELISPNSCTNAELAEAVLKSKGLLCAPELQEELKKLVNLPVTTLRAPLLAFACNSYNYEIAKLLVDYGADANPLCNHNVTPLWFICRRKLPKEHRTAGRKIAELLLENGATVNIVNDGGVALFNEDTDEEIAKFIRRYYPAAIRGEGPGSNDTDENKTSISSILAITGLLIGIVLGTVFDKFLMGFLWGGTLAGIGAFFGYQIDRLRSGEKGIAGKSVRNILITVAALVVFIMLLTNCTADNTEYGYCPNCHSKMETQYIRNGYCTRCDGRDWGN